MKTDRFKFFRVVFNPVILLFNRIHDRIRTNLRLELIITFLLCMLAYIVVYQLSNELFARKSAYIDYTNGKDIIDKQGQQVVEKLINYAEQDTKDNSDYLKELKAYIDEKGEANKVKILIVDLDGKVILKSQNAPEKEIDIFTIISNAMTTRIYQTEFFPNFIKTEAREEFYSFYPAVLNNKNVYVVTSGIPQATINYIEGKSSFSVIYGLIAFIVAFYFLTRKKMQYIEELAKGLIEISKGNLSYRVAEKSKDELGSLANNINYMASQLERKIERERQIERAKNELITNVSHDLRTPLTSIMGYLRLLKDKKYETMEQHDNFVDIAYGKAEKLKSLIEDLFEYTKFSNESIQLNLQKVAINEMLEQLIEELVPIAEENQLTFITDFPSEKILVDLDSDKAVRVFENLLMNAILYSYKPGEIFVNLSQDEEYITVVIKNMGQEICKEDLENLFERFYRVEKSRSSLTGGSGLGLAIAKNIIDLHGGKIWAECDGELISFHVQFKKENGQ